ncbi:MAG: glutamate 5-kinase [Chloroflexi bacterium]|nr:glutamate 5-kinase [Chloroflexota bacterium]
MSDTGTSLHQAHTNGHVDPHAPAEQAAAPPAYRRIVVKFGTNLLTAGTDRLDLEAVAHLVSQVARLHQAGHQIIVVSSGAVAAGRYRLGMVRTRRKDIPFKQVLAAVGQSRLMDAYDQLFSWHGIIVAQALLTKNDLSDRVGYLNARNTLLALLDLEVIAIVNENDVVAVDELVDARFGDNDTLSALVANLVDADVLVILTDIAGLYTADPKRHADARLIPRVETIDASIEALARGTSSDRGTGGMLTKLQAARLATASGVAVVIADGHAPHALERIAAGEPLGTYFAPAGSGLESRQRWMLASVSRRDAVVVDPGAAAALRERHTSLLPAGITEVRGDFQRGDIIAILDREGIRIACGIANYPATDLVRIKGHRSSQIETVLGHHYGAEVVHRNNLVVV